MFSETYQYRPDVYAAVLAAVPLICPAKKDVVTFFRGAGLRHPRLAALDRQVLTNRDALKKHDMVRELLDIANEDATDAGLRTRREILRRVVDFNNYEQCWPDKQLAAKGAVAKVRELVHEKDAFTRMEQAREREASTRIAASQRAAEAKRKRVELRDAVKRELFAVFAIRDAHERGAAFERALNTVFALDGMLVREPFRLVGDAREGIVEQIDGVIELNGDLYLVEAKFWAENMGVGDVSQHMVRVAQRADMRGLYVAHPGFSPAAIRTVTDALQRGVFVLATAEELVALFESDGSVVDWLTGKVRHAMIDRDPHRLLKLTHRASS